MFANESDKKSDTISIFLINKSDIKDKKIVGLINNIFLLVIFFSNKLNM